MRRSIWVKDADWSSIKAQAEAAGLSIGKYLAMAHGELSVRGCHVATIPEVPEKVKVVDQDTGLIKKAGVKAEANDTFRPYSKDFQTRKKSKK